MIIRYSPSLLSAALIILGTAQPAQALWPFQTKSSTFEGLVNAGQLGLDDVAGRVVGIGDWNGDQSSDLFALSPDRRTLTVYLWDSSRHQYIPGPSHTSSSRVINVIAADWNHDGKLDLLLQTEGERHGWWGGGAEVVDMSVLLQDESGAFGETWTVASSTGSQPILFDADGSMRPSLLGYPQSDDDDRALGIQTWVNNRTGLVLQPSPLIQPFQACKLANPHSSAFIDIDGDCQPDLVLQCQHDKTSRSSLQVWLNRGSKGFELSRTYMLPRGAGPLTFADMNRDGSIDMVFPVCAHHSPSTGIGTECSIHVAYNRQVPLCTSEATSFRSDGSLECRGWGELCVRDPNYQFSFTQDDGYTIIPLSSISTSSSILLSVPENENIPLPLRLGDYNQDGFPDLLLTAVTSTGSGGLFARDQTRVMVLENVQCRNGLAGCDSGQVRTFSEVRGRGWEVLEGMTDVVGASWLDMDNDGSLDILVQRTGDQKEGIFAFVSNKFYHDAFFLKAHILNGACNGKCVPSQGGKGYSAAGAMAIGATCKFTVLDTLGRRGAQQGALLLPQSGYHALGLPYAFIGLGRTNNYIERLSVGVSLRYRNLTSLDSIIPNSRLLINPPAIPISFSRDSAASTSLDVGDEMREWHTELFLQPGQWVPYVGMSVVVTVLALGGVVWYLHEREKKEDELERRRALHAINFQAL